MQLARTGFYMAICSTTVDAGEVLGGKNNSSNIHDKVYVAVMIGQR
jgi:hypothetical protein